MKPPLKYVVYEKVKEHGNMFDTDLLAELNRSNYDLSMSILNKALFQLEIAGLLTVRWVGKDKRRVELVEKAKEEAT